MHFDSMEQSVGQARNATAVPILKWGLVIQL